MPMSDAQFVAEIWDDVIDTIKKVHDGRYTVAEALLEIHNDIDNWTIELVNIVDGKPRNGK